LFGGLAGQVALKLKRAELLPQLTASDLNATLRLGKDEIVLADAVGKLAGGGLSGQMSFHRAEDGLTAQARISVIGADVSALLPASQPISGSVDLTAELEGMGLSPVALIGSMKGSGTIALKDGLITGLNPRVFDVVTQAADQGMPVDSGRLSDLVSESLDSGRLSVARTDSALRIDSGQIRVDKTTVESKDAALSVACTFDLTDGLLDARLVLTGHGEAAGARPDISVGLKGPLTTPSRSVDVSALAGWLTLRAVENQAKRLQAIESAPSQPRARPASKNKQAPALPAPIDIRPAPAPRNAGRPGASVGPQN
jgi:large subunit ribosomal protein L24